MKRRRARPSIAVRGAWAMRIIAHGFRRRQATLALGCVAFSIVTVAILVGAAFVSAGRTEPRPFSSTGGAELVAFLRDDLPSVSRDALSVALGRLPGVAGVRLLGGDEALARMRRDLGDRASVLDGVEEGFLPTTLEIALEPGGQGVERADAIAWRLRRMEGITDVDTLRTSDDERLARLQAIDRHSRRVGLALAAATGALALCLAALAMRRPRAEARLLSSLGFTAAAVAAPGAILGGICAAVGAIAGVCVSGLASRIGSAAWWLGSAPVARMTGETRWLAVGSLVVVASAGACLGWFGWRASGRVDDGREIAG